MSATGRSTDPNVGFETATIDQVISDARALYEWFLAEIRRKNYSPTDPDSVTTALKTAATACNGKFNNMVNTYPFFSRDLATTGFLDADVLRKYFHWVSANPWQDDADRLTVQAKYYYFKTMAVHTGRKSEAEAAAQQVFEQTRDELLKDDAKLKKVVSDTQKKYAQITRQARDELVEEIRVMLQKASTI